MCLSDLDRRMDMPEDVCMRYLSIDSLGGASGDMLLGALLDLGVELRPLAERVRQIVPEPVEITAESVTVHGIRATRATVRTPTAPDTTWIGHGKHAHAAGGHRGLAAIAEIIEHADMPTKARSLALGVFQRLAAAEAKVHGVAIADIHFHEVGAADAIADVAGCCLALEQLGIEGVRVGPLPAGQGTLRCAHGEMPNPAPATMRLLEGFEIEQTDEPFELVTPTGAALLAGWRAALSAPPSHGRVLRCGYGVGQRALRRRPNVVRATLMESGTPADDLEERMLTLLETNLDDCNPQWVGDAIATLLAQGALDAWATPVVMKKGRPGLKLSVLCDAAQADELKRQVFLATPTFGIRAIAVARTALARRIETATTPFGPIRVKIGLLDGREITRSPEYEDCVARAREAGVTPRAVAESCGHTAG
ncbi:MAG: nickel pincer cofactor biosynthesis protein LarC [Kiritimatiellae bacterium]|nr:nickel pincer cofactor biosynthesis protein LarC [Kiritimatiellia bacterium]